MFESCMISLKYSNIIPRLDRIKTKVRSKPVLNIDKLLGQKVHINLIIFQKRECKKNVATISTTATTLTSRRVPTKVKTVPPAVAFDLYTDLKC